MSATRGGKLAVHLRNGDALRVGVAYVALGTTIDHSATRHLHGLKRTKAGFVIASSHQETSIPGLYAVGDCVNSLSQVSVAVGHAAIAATRVHHDLGF
jgi:thioredoxin reductase (NADPH)